VTPEPINGHEPDELVPDELVEKLAEYGELWFAADDDDEVI
jgi:hypothetical protein